MKNRFIKIYGQKIYNKMGYIVVVIVVIVCEQFLSIDVVCRCTLNNAYNITICITQAYATSCIIPRMKIDKYTCHRICTSSAQTTKLCFRHEGVLKIISLN